MKKSLFFLLLIGANLFGQKSENPTAPFLCKTNYVMPTPITTGIRGVINVYPYRQNGQSWSSNQLGTCSGLTIASDGCAITCVAMLLKTSGVNVDPGQLNTWLTNNGGYSSGCLINWNIAANYLGSYLTWYGSYSPFDLATTKNEIDAGNPVILKTTYGSYDHFVVIKGYTGSGINVSDFLVIDPLITGDQTLSNYTLNEMRIYHNVTGTLTPTCTYTVTVLGSGTFPLTDGWKFWKDSSIPANYYTINITISNLNGSHYSVNYADASGNSLIQMVTDQTATTQNIQFQPPTSYLNGNQYRFTVAPQGSPNSPWCTSSYFYNGNLPDLTINVNPTQMYIGQQATVSWTVSGGIPTLADGGWINDIQLQWYQNGTALTNLNMMPVSNHSYTFTVPSSITGGAVPGSNFQISGSNPANTSIPQGYVYSFSSYFNISSYVGLEDILINNEITIYPNPAINKINITMDKNLFSELSLKIFNSFGQQIIYKNKLTSDEIDISNLPIGIYFIQLATKEKSIIKKFIKN